MPALYWVQLASVSLLISGGITAPFAAMIFLF
jgi:hypothetical protein